MPRRRLTEEELDRSILFEMVAVGHYIRVSAIDPVTNTEVTTVGDASAPESQLKIIARNKLYYVLRKKGLLGGGEGSGGAGIVI